MQSEIVIKLIILAVVGLISTFLHPPSNLKQAHLYIVINTILGHIPLLLSLDLSSIRLPVDLPAVRAAPSPTTAKYCHQSQISQAPDLKLLERH